MQRSIPAIFLVGLLSACSSTTAPQVAATVAGTALGVGSVFPVVGSPATGGFGADKLPDTPQCREYKRFARVAGSPGTMSPLIKKYNACLNSAPNSKASREYRCAPGTYYSWVDGVRKCRKK